VTVTGTLARKFGRTKVALTLAEFDAVLAACLHGDHRDRDLAAACRLLAQARDERRRAVDRAGKW
jgi:hypothetical protein